MDERIEFPDVEATVCTILGDDPPTHGKVPNPRPDAFHVVTRIPGTGRSNRVTDLAEIIVESWGLTRDQAHDNAQRARTEVLAARASVIDGVTVYQVTEVSGPGRLPDPLSTHDRYTQTFQVGVRGHAPTGS